MIVKVFGGLLYLVTLLNATLIPTVKTPKGSIQGSYGQSYNGRTFMQFLGVPYAKPPIGNLRFEEPQPMDKWSGIWVANTTSTCLQVLHTSDPTGGKSQGEEDCLHLNVFVPKCKQRKNMDVLVHFHGGAFMFGSGYDYSKPKYLMDRNVILVTVNFRVGVLGFLSTEDKYLPGNLGMKDQVMSLQWIKENIIFFGGNPNSVTITGSSAGGSSVQLHYLSPLSRGLFARGISSSGCALNNWVLMENAMNKTRIIARAVGCNKHTSKDLVECLKSRPGKQLNEAIKLLRVWLFNPYSPLALVIDKHSKTPFLPEHPYKLLKEGKVLDAPWIVSTTTSEGLYPAAEFMVNPDYLPALDDNWDRYAPAILHYIETAPKDNDVSTKIRKKYLGNNPIDNSTYLQLVQLTGDRLFVYDMETAARLQAKATSNPVYYYQFDYLAEETPSLAYLFTHLTVKYGVSHGDEMLLIFSYSKTENLPRMTPNDESVKEFLIDMWVNFAATGKPGNDWTPVSKKKDAAFDYLYINRTQEMRQAKELGKRSFWESLKFLENKNLFK